MKIEYIEEFNSDNPTDSLLRLYDFNLVEANELIAVFKNLADKSVLEFKLNELSCIDSINGIELTLQVGKKDIGITKILEKSFICNLSPSGWSNAIELTKPFTGSTITNGYQWLYDLNTDIDFLLSTDGRW